MRISDGSSDLCSSDLPAGHPVSDKPLALLAPRLAAPVIEAARHGAAAKLALRGRGGTLAAQNIIGRSVHSGRPRLVVTMPRSRWTDSPGARGAGIASWPALALRTAPALLLPTVTCPSHRYLPHSK